MKRKLRDEDEDDEDSSFVNPLEVYERLKSELRLDKHNLDEEAIRQPDLYQEISEAHSEAVATRDTLKEALQAKDAELAEGYREKAAKSGERTSETKIGDQVSQDPEHQKAYKLWVKAAKLASMLQGLLWAADQRNKVLKLLADLYLSGYFERVSGTTTKKRTEDARAAAGREGMRQLRNARKGNPRSDE